MKKLLKDKHGEINQVFIKGIMVAVCALVLGFVGVSAFMDERSEREYLEWAREENRKVFDDSQQIRMNEKQLLKLRRELNDSFYQRLEHDLPVRILIVGDAYGNGFGARSKSAVWSKLLQTGLNKKYGVKVEVKNVTLSGMNGGYGAWAQVMKLPDGTAGSVLSDVGAVKDRQGAYTGENVDAKTITASRENEYDLCIVSLGMTDDPQMFELYYEGVLREVRRKFSKCSIISLLSNQALTAPELGYADDNYDALYRISKHYDAAVLNVGLEMTDPDAAEKGATMSQIPFGAATAESLAADMRADGISEKKVREVASKDLEERSAAAEAAIRKYTIDGLYLNNEGQKFLSDRLLRLIDKKVSKGTGYDDKEIAPIKKEVVTLDQYHYFTVSELVRLDEFTYVLAENRVKAAADSGDKVSGAGAAGVGGVHGKVLKPGEPGSIVGVDYDLVPGDNDVYAAVGDGTEGFGRIIRSHSDTDKEHYIYPLNEGYSCERDGNLILGFSTKAQADTLHGVILGGDFTLPSYFDGYQQVPYIGLTDEEGNPVALNKDGRPTGEGSLDNENESAEADETTEATKAETTAAKTTAAETKAAKNTTAATSVAETTAAKTTTAGTRVAETTAARTTTAATAAVETTAARTTTTATAAVETTAARTTTAENAATETAAAETTAATFGNDQSAQGNATAVAESFQNLAESLQVAENLRNLSADQQTAETSNSLSAIQEAAGSSEASYETYTETYPEAEVVIIHDGSEGANFGSGTAYTAENSSSDYPAGVPEGQ